MVVKCPQSGGFEDYIGVYDAETGFIVLKMASKRGNLSHSTTLDNHFAHKEARHSIDDFDCVWASLVNNIVQKNHFVATREMRLLTNEHVSSVGAPVDSQHTGVNTYLSEHLGNHFARKLELQRGLEGDERFIGVPGVWSQLSELLPQAQQAMFDLMVSKATSSATPSHQYSIQQRNHTPESSTPTGRYAADGPGCTATTTLVAGTLQAYVSSVVVVNNNRHNSLSNVCMECDERPPNVQLQPCGHIVLCSQCATVMKKCPECRVAIIKDKINLL
ncbi:hypothetical protein Pelo_9306 [Pelomyxa schiedti]|nr:hypothetical protein Pelo_9306 [Pelomyxa schiedti]